MTDKRDNFYDVCVIGGGPAGLTAALYLARARYRVLVVEKEKFGGQITITSEVVNYPGVLKTDGSALTETMRKQAEAFGAEFMLAEVESLDITGDVRKVKTSGGIIECFGILIATGAHPRMVGFKGEAEFRGHGVAYCATCDGEFFTGKDVFVVGGGFAAAEEAVFLTKYARHVTILIRGAGFKCAQSTADAALNHPKITVLTHVSIDEAAGDSVLRSLTYHNSETGEVTEYRPPEGDTFGIFVFAGYDPATELIRDIAELNEQGYVITDRNQQTSVPGVFAAGDVCVKVLRQVVTAVGDGAIAATELEKYAARLQAETGLKPEFPELKTAPGDQDREENAGAHTGDSGSSAGGSLFTPDMSAQLKTVFGRMESSLKLKLYLDERPVSAELRAYMDALSGETDKLSVKIVSEGERVADGVELTELPCVRIVRADGSWTGLAFHGVPGGHEFTSFVLGLYNAAGPGQALDDSVRADIAAIDQPVTIKIMVSLSCTMCPDLVTQAQHIAAESDFVTADIYDLNHFPDMRDKYQVMSVPCMLINDSPPVFGKKNIKEILDLITK